MTSSPFWFIGTCGIADTDWRGNFYPAKLRELDFLEFYASRFNSIEINTTFYGVRERRTIRRWKLVTPPEFRFCAKFLRDVTHESSERLSAASTLDLAKRFFDTIQELGEKLAVILMQFPPDFSIDHHSALLRFLDRISCPARLVIEFRHDSWWTEETANLLRERKIGWVGADLGNYPHIAAIPKPGLLRPFGLRPIVPTTDFVYARFIGKHGQFPIHRGEYFDSTDRVNWWFERLKRIAHACGNIRDIYAFFDNDFSGHAPTAARRFADKAELPQSFGLSRIITSR